MSDYWLSTKSPRQMFRPEYQDAKTATFLRENKGIDAALLANDLGVNAPCVRAYQRKLGLRKITNPRDAL